MRTAVVLPAPFGPSRPSTVPASTSSETPSRARTLPRGKTLTRSCASTARERSEERAIRQRNLVIKLLTCQDNGHAAELAQQLRSEIMGYLGAASDFDERLAKKLKLSRTDMRCLDLIGRHGPMTAGRLAEESGLTTGAVTFILDRLEEAGMVTRRRDTEDRRRVWVEIVPRPRSGSQGCSSRSPRRCARWPSASRPTSSPSCATSCARPRRSSSARSGGSGQRTLRPTPVPTFAPHAAGGARRESRLARPVPGREG